MTNINRDFNPAAGLICLDDIDVGTAVEIPDSTRIIEEPSADEKKHPSRRKGLELVEIGGYRFHVPPVFAVRARDTTSPLHEKLLLIAATAASVAKKTGVCFAPDIYHGVGTCSFVVALRKGELRVNLYALNFQEQDRDELETVITHEARHVTNRELNNKVAADIRFMCRASDDIQRASWMYKKHFAAATQCVLDVYEGLPNFFEDVGRLQQALSSGVHQVEKFGVKLSQGERRTHPKSHYDETRILDSIKRGESFFAKDDAADFYKNPENRRWLRLMVKLKRLSIAPDGQAGRESLAPAHRDIGLKAALRMEDFAYSISRALELAADEGIVDHATRPQAFSSWLRGVEDIPVALYVPGSAKRPTHPTHALRTEKIAERVRLAGQREHTPNDRTR